MRKYCAIDTIRPIVVTATNSCTKIKAVNDRSKHHIVEAIKVAWRNNQS
jgi:hypothetical protein